MVENEIVNIMRQRFEDCVLYEAPDHTTKCVDMLNAYRKASENWFTKCKFSTQFDSSFSKFDCFLDGDLGAYANSKSAFMKQKHRMIWERRHGPVGSGMKNTEDE